MHYYSQYKQDKFLNTVVLNNKRDGFFIDIGAHDGITFSNSIFFEKYKNYSGICVEPNPKVFEKLNNNRSCIKINACIGFEPRKANFLAVSGYGEMLSGLLEFYDAKHLERVDKVIEQHGGTKQIIEVDVITFNSLLNKVDGAIDFCSIDTEGNELSILQAINFDNLKINSFTIENNYDNPEIPRILEKNGYIKIYQLSCDQVFVKRELFDISMRFRLLKYKLYQKLNRFRSRK